MKDQMKRFFGKKIFGAKDRKAKENMLLASLVEHSSDAIFSRDMTRTITGWNHGAEKMFGYTKEEAIGRTILELRLFNLTDSRMLSIEKKLMEQGSYSVERIGYRKDGRSFFVSVTLNTVKDDKGQLIAIVVVVKDITERKELEEKLKKYNEALEETIRVKTEEAYKNELRFRALLEDSAEIITLLDGSFNVIYRSPNAEKITGWTNEEINIVDGGQFIHPDDFAMYSEITEAIVASPGKKISCCFRSRHKNGHYLQLEGTVTNLLQEETINAIVFNLRDSTERNFIENALRQSEEKYHSMLENISESFLVMDNDWHFVYVNNAAEKMFNRSRSYLKGRNFKDEYPNAVNAPISAAYLEAIRTQKPVFVDAFSFAADIWVQVSIYPSVSGVVFYFKDITQRVLAEKELKQSEEKYRTLVERTSDGLISLDTEWNFVYVNKAAIRMFADNTADGNLIGKNLWEVFPTAIGGPFYKAYYAALENQREDHVRGYSTGTGLWLEAHIYPSPTGLTILFRDVTDQVKAEQEMWKMEEKYRTLVERITDAFISVDTKWDITYLNRQAAKLIGSTPEDLLWKNMMLVFAELVTADHFEWLSNAMKEQHHVTNVAYLPGKDCWVENHIYPSENGLSLVLRDITTKMNHDLALKRSEEIRNSIMAAALDAVICVDMSESIIVWNQQAEKMFGWQEKEVLGRQIADVIIPGNYQSFHVEQFRKYKATGEGGIFNKTIEVFAVNKKGEQFPAEMFVAPVKQESGDFFCAFIRDISERKKSQEEILQSRNRLNQAQAIAHVGHWEINYENNTIACSDELYRIFGLEPAYPLTIEEWSSYVHPDDMEFVNRALQHSRTGKSDFSLYFRIVRKDGVLKYIHADTKLLFDKNGNITGMYGVNHDITEMKRLELELQERQRIEQLKLTATALEAQEKERNAIGIELHDNVNQILVGTKMLLAMAKRNPVKHIDYLETGMNNLQQAIDENRKIAHELTAPDFDIASFADRILGLTDSMLRSAGLDVHVNIKTLDESLLNRQQLLAVYRIVQEQCTNIVKHSKANLVNIFLSSGADRFHMVISDDGIGVDSHKKILGIGLTNIKSRMSVFGGTAEVKTAPGKGFTLKVNMPLKSDLIEDRT